MRVPYTERQTETVIGRQPHSFEQLRCACLRKARKRCFRNGEWKPAVEQQGNGMTHRAWGGQDCKERSKIVWSLPGFAPSARICNIEGQCWKRSVPGCRDSTTSKQQAREQQQSRRVMSSITIACEAGVLKTPSSGAIDKPTWGDTIGLSGVFAIARHPGVKRAIGLSGGVPWPATRG